MGYLTLAWSIAVIKETWHTKKYYRALYELQCESMWQDSRAL